MSLYRNIIGIAAAAILFSPFFASAASSIDVSPFQGELIGPGDFDRLVFDFTLTPPSGDADTLAALGLRNSFDARGIRDISKLVLWKDRGQPGFRGWEDEKIASSTWSVDRTNWSFSELSVAIPKDGQRFLITAEIAGQILVRRRLELVIPISDDRGTIGVYDSGDEGLFFGSKKVLPAITDFAISSGVVQTIHTRDLYSPLTYITAPSRGGTIPVAPVRITGVTRERGRDFVREIIVTITSDGKQIAELRPTISGINATETWALDWTPPSEGAYTISAIGIDGNSAREEANEGNTVTFTVAKPEPPLPSREVAPPLPSQEVVPSKEVVPDREVAPQQKEVQPRQEATPESTIRSWSCTTLKTCDAPLTKRLLGRILLKVQGKGEAFYVHPVDNKAYYLGRPADAFAVMRFLSLGINEADFEKAQQCGTSAGVPAFCARLRGRIILRVEQKGEAFYYPADGKEGLYLGRPADAFRIMREQGTGISDADLTRLELKAALSSWSPASGR